jgi:ribosome-binding protein aMBF1 (putative translation factor)
MNTQRATQSSPVGTSHRDAMRHRAHDDEYRAELERLAPYEALARIVIRRRGRLGISQVELAKRMETSHSAVSRIESGQHPTTVETLRRLARALETQLVLGFADDAGPSDPTPLAGTDRGVDLVTV